MSINLDAIKARLKKVHAAGVSGVTVRLADYGLRVTVQMRSWDGTTAHDGYEAVTHLLGNAPADIAALVEEVERLRAEVAAERAAVVVWLREVADAPETYIDEGIALRDASATIERGEHRREEAT
jgi:hypothetical protein